jgi:RNA 2',3'-cyclic 3'-phosphodiesterase
MRLFIALEIPSEIHNALAAFLKELQPIAPKTKWVRPENLHVTLKFLGETDPAKLGQIESTLKTVRSAKPVTLEFRGLGFFPNEKRPRVFWAGMSSSANLRMLAADIDESMHQHGFALEQRAFAPHLTLARFNPPGLPATLGSTAKQHASRVFGSMTAREFHLIESKRKPTGAEYTTLKSFPFTTET